MNLKTSGGLKEMLPFPLSHSPFFVIFIISVSFSACLSFLLSFFHLFVHSFVRSFFRSFALSFFSNVNGVGNDDECGRGRNLFCDGGGGGGRGITHDEAFELLSPAQPNVNINIARAFVAKCDAKMTHTKEREREREQESKGKKEMGQKWLNKKI